MNRSSHALLLLAPLLAPLADAAGLPDPAAEYASRAEGLAGKKDAGAWLKLAEYAEDNLLWDQREAALRTVVGIDAGNGPAHARLDERKWGEGWLPAGEADRKEAEEMQAKGLVFYGATWVSAKEADKLREADRKACGWNCDLRVETPHFLLYSARPLAFSRRIAALLENALSAYQRFHAGIWKPQPLSKPIRVYLFGDRASHEKKVQADLGHPAGVPTGMYGQATRTCYLGFERDYKPGLDPDSYIEEQTARVAVHEIVHALDDLLCRTYTAAPTRSEWVLEGRADHFGLSVLGRQVLPGRVHLLRVEGSLEDRCIMLGKAVDSLPLDKLLAMDTARFTGDGVREHYVMSWALTHFLFHGEGGTHAPAFRKFLAGCPKQSSLAVFEKTVGRLTALEPAFKNHVRKVLLPALQ